TDLCPADQSQYWVDLVNQGTSSARGYIQDTASSSIRAAVEDDHMDYTVTLNQPVNMTGGDKQTQVTSLLNRANQDTDTTSTDYDTYLANHDNTPMRRLAIVPITNNYPSYTVIGFATVFLPMTQNNGGSKALCATFIGNASLPDGGGGSGSGSNT